MDQLNLREQLEKELQHWTDYVKNNGMEGTDHPYQETISNLQTRLELQRAGVTESPAADQPAASEGVSL